MIKKDIMAKQEVNTANLYPEPVSKVFGINNAR
jgi:hypothetical protein